MDTHIIDNQPLKINQDGHIVCATENYTLNKPCGENVNITPDMLMGELIEYNWNGESVFGSFLKVVCPENTNPDNTNLVDIRCQHNGDQGVTTNLTDMKVNVRGLM